MLALDEVINRTVEDIHGLAQLLYQLHSPLAVFVLILGFTGDVGSLLRLCLGLCCIRHGLVEFGLALSQLLLQLLRRLLSRGCIRRCIGLQLVGRKHHIRLFHHVLLGRVSVSFLAIQRILQSFKVLLHLRKSCCHRLFLHGDIHLHSLHSFTEGVPLRQRGLEFSGMGHVLRGRLLRISHRLAARCDLSLTCCRLGLHLLHLGHFS
mmetsp:Transcript_35529/g.49549  ORF Transcript_35529/g.49549 Transcript_35529/m.49549 type:complete len:207 (-) Transcript_35529:286-906(-)